jgi:uncharacterized membrane protein
MENSPNYSRLQKKSQIYALYKIPTAISLSLHGFDKFYAAYHIVCFHKNQHVLNLSYNCCIGLDDDNAKIETTLQVEIVVQIIREHNKYCRNRKIRGRLPVTPCRDQSRD